MWLVHSVVSPAVAVAGARHTSTCQWSVLDSVVIRSYSAASVASSTSSSLTVDEATLLRRLQLTVAAPADPNHFWHRDNPHPLHAHAACTTTQRLDLTFLTMRV